MQSLTYRGHKCCKKINPEFKKAEGELYNSWPAALRPRENSGKNQAGRCDADADMSVLLISSALNISSTIIRVVVL